jgi:hypothetical protein
MQGLPVSFSSITFVALDHLEIDIPDLMAICIKMPNMLKALVPE